MAFYCPECDTRHETEPRYCAECGTEVNPDADTTEQTPSNNGFFETHKLKILVLTGLMLLPMLPAFLATGTPGAMIGMLTGAGLAALAISYVLVYLFVGLADSVRRTTGTRD